MFNTLSGIAPSQTTHDTSLSKFEQLDDTFQIILDLESPYVRWWCNILLILDFVPPEPLERVISGRSPQIAGPRQPSIGSTPTIESTGAQQKHLPGNDQFEIRY